MSADSPKRIQGNYSEVSIDRAMPSEYSGPCNQRLERPLACGLSGAAP